MTSSTTGAAIHDRSFVDPISNAVLLSPIDLQSELGDVVQLRLPRSCLSTFLHETTHHWCFYSPVGMALAFLAMRARRRGLLAETDDTGNTGDTWAVVDDLVRYRVATAALRPFGEGMALFAEFDDVPTTSKVMSDVMTSAWTCFLLGRRTDDSDEPLHMRLFSLLHDLRSDPATAKRKTNLLMQPLSAGPAAGYLPGYLLVKNLWIDSARRNARLADADLALVYLYTWVFCDFGLVAHLLDPDVSDISAVDPIVGHVVARLQAFVDADHDKNIDLLECAADLPFLVDPHKPREQTPDLGADPALWALGRERLEAAMHELEEEAASSSSWQRGLARRDQWALAQRELLCLGRCTVDVRVAPTGWVTVWADGQVIFAGRSDLDVADRRGHGTLEAFLNPWRWGRYAAVVVTLDGRRVLTWTSRELDAETREQFDGYRVTLDAIAAEDELLDRFVAGHVADQQYVLDAIEETYEPEINRIYTRLALGFVPPDRLDARAIEMRDDGLYPVFGSAALVRTLAWIGVVSHLGLRRAEYPRAFDGLRRFHRFAGSFDEALDSIRSAGREKLDDPLVYDNGAGYFCVV